MMAGLFSSRAISPWNESTGYVVRSDDLTDVKGCWISVGGGIRRVNTINSGVGKMYIYWM